MQSEYALDPFQIPDDTYRTSSTSEHQLDVETFCRPSCAYPNRTIASVQHPLGWKRNASRDGQLECTTEPLQKFCSASQK
jgi:hypothetical protein